MTLGEVLLLSGAAVLGGALNSVAGGGSFLTFPALVFAGVSPIVANATSAVALWPASVAGAVAYRKELAHSKSSLVPLSVASVVGGLLGAWLLLRTSDGMFVRLLPFLLLFATLTFTFGPRVARGLRARGTSVPIAVATLVQLVIALYGGYFGGGMGIMMLAVFALVTAGDMHVMNALKTFLATLINLVAIVTFIVNQAVDWLPGGIMIASATVGGYAGARLARRLDPAHVRVFVLGVAWAMTIYFFARFLVSNSA